MVWKKLNDHQHDGAAAVGRLHISSQAPRLPRRRSPTGRAAAAAAGFGCDLGARYRPTMRSASAMRPCCASQRGDSGRRRRIHQMHERADRADQHHPAPAVEPERRRAAPAARRAARRPARPMKHDALVEGEGRPRMLLRHQFRDIGVDGHQFDADADAGDEAPQIDAMSACSGTPGPTSR